MRKKVLELSRTHVDISLTRHGIAAVIVLLHCLYSRLLIKQKKKSEEVDQSVTCYEVKEHTHAVLERG